MKLLVLLDDIPSATHGIPGVTAVHIVSFQILSALREKGCDIHVQSLLKRSFRDKPLTEHEQNTIASLKEAGMTVHEPLSIADHVPYIKKRLRTLSMLFSHDESCRHVYPGYGLKKTISQLCNDVQPDAVLTLWAPQGVAASSDITSVPRVAYHGDIEFEPRACRLVLDRTLFGLPQPSLLHPRSLLQYIDDRIRLYITGRTHLRLLRDISCIANTTASNATYYTKHGHPNSVYVGNTWMPDDLPVPEYPTGEVTMIGHVGALDRTGSTYGLRYLLRDLLPALEKEFGDVPFSIHIVGGGQAQPGIRPLLKHPRVVMRGFVDDLDSEARAAHAFCILNNAGPYRAAYTRHLVGWSLGACVVAHSNSKEAIPELSHGENAILGADPATMARDIKRACLDPAENVRLRTGGRDTFLRTSTPDLLATRLYSLLTSL